MTTIATSRMASDQWMQPGKVPSHGHRSHAFLAQHDRNDQVLADPTQLTVTSRISEYG
jgi:hypothetical protein